MLGNSRIDPCSAILKRELLDKWVRDRFTPANCVRYVGIDWTEENRFTRHKARLEPWPVRAPLCEEPWNKITKERCTPMRCAGACPASVSTRWACPTPTAAAAASRLA